MQRARASVSGLRTDNGENWGNPDGCKFWKHDDAMRMMTWQDATRKQMTWQRQRITERHLAHRSRGVTTLHHYKRISSRDLEWHRRENGREREEVKLSCFFDKWVKPKNLARLNKFEKRIQRRWTKSKNSVRKEGQRTLRKTLRLKGKIYIESTSVKKVCKTWYGEKNLSRGHDTPVKWISKRKKHDFDKTKWWVEKSNIAMPPEERNRR